MAPADQPSAPTAPPPAVSTTCANCGAPMAPDQRYCLACGTRRGDPRVPISPPPAEPAAQAQQQQGRPADVSPLAAVIGIALLGGMLLIGVLIGRGDSNDQTTPAPVVQVGEGGSTTTLSAGTESGGGQTTPSSVTSEWPSGTNGFTIQVSSIGKSSATPESVDAAKQTAVDEGASDASVLDSDLYSSLPPGNYIIYSGVYDNRKDAEAALADLGDTIPNAQVVEVSAKGGDSGASSVPESDLSPDLGSTGEVTDPSELLQSQTGGVTESEK